MNKAIEKVNLRIEKEQEKLKSLEDKQNEISGLIKETTSNIATLEKQLEQEKLKVLTELIKSKDVSIDELITATNNGNFKEVQDKLINQHR